MSESKSLIEQCIEACDNCAMQCNGSAFQGEMMGGMVEACNLGRLCAAACSSHASLLKREDYSEADACLGACTRFIPEAENVYRHLASFQQSAVAARAVIELIGEMSVTKQVAK